MGERIVHSMTVPSGAAVLDLLPDLARALAGDGPARLPLGQTDPRAANIAETLAAGECLGPGEDDSTDPTALVMPTSGSTGSPKGVLLSAGQLAASAAATEHRLGGSGHWLLTLPAEHIAGMQVLLRAAQAGTEPVVIDTQIPFTAERFIDAAQRVPGPRRYVSLVPTQLRRVVADREASTVAAELFDAVLVGGAATPAALLDQARQAGITVVTTYGMTETCGGCVYDGHPLDGVVASLYRTKALVLTGPMVARGYRHRPNDSAFAQRGSFVTADTGEINSEGRVTVTGRIDDVIVTGGVNVAPAVVEAALVDLSGITEVVVVGTPDAQWGQAVTAVIVPVPDGPRWQLPGLRATLRDAPTALAATHLPQRLVTVDDLPRLPSGKPDRQAVRDLARAYADTHPEDTADIHPDHTAIRAATTPDHAASTPAPSRSSAER